MTGKMTGLPASVPCGKCGKPIIIIGRFSGGIAVEPHTCPKVPKK